MSADDFFLFVSHVSEDQRAAAQVVDELERRGVRCWIAPRDVRPGAAFDDEIADAIEQCRAMLLIFSNRCNDSEYIRREITVAGNANKVILPFRIEQVEPKRALSVRLANLHWIDGFIAREKAIDEVVRAVQPSKKKKQDGTDITDDQQGDAAREIKTPMIFAASRVKRLVWRDEGRVPRSMLVLSFAFLLITGGAAAIYFNGIRAPLEASACTDMNVRVQFRSDFKKPDPQWQLDGPNEYFVDNQFAIKPDAGWGVWWTIPAFVFKNATYCVDVKTPSDANEPGTSARGGLVFWLIDNSNFYVAEIYLDSSYSVRRALNRVDTGILPRTKFAKLKAGPAAVNQIKVTAIDNLVTLFFNGEKATEFRAQAPKDGGKVGVYAESDQRKSNEWRFLSIVVTE
jgi:hypothetical protein